MAELKKFFTVLGVALWTAVAFVLWVNLRGGEPAPEPRGASLRGKVCVMPVGDVPEEDLAFAREILEAHLGRETVVYEPLPLQEEYYYDDRGQYGAAGFLKYVEVNGPAEAYRLVGITAEDITIPELNFLFGLGRCPGRGAIFSTYRLDFYCGTEARRDVRFAKLLVHELGHTFGLRHCRRETCVMKFAEGYATVDNQRLAMCERCENHLCKRAALDPAERRADLGAVIKKHHLWEEAGGVRGLTPPPAPANLAPEITVGG